MWRPDHLPTILVDIAAEALRKRSEELAAEQAVEGLDALSEVQFHPLLAEAFKAVGMGVWPEQPYPGQPGKRPKRAERERCDLVLTEDVGAPIGDPVARLIELDRAEATLFAPQAEAMSDERRLTPPEEAFWLEVKLVGQFCYSAGIPGANQTYTSELLTVAPSDLPKLARDQRIRHAGLLLIHFTADDEVAKHDLTALMHRCLDRALPVSMPSIARFSIDDRIGNQRCTLALIPVRSDAVGEP
jgi:hypothetical protein